MLTIIAVAFVIFWIVQIVLVDDFFFAAIITAIIMFFFVNVDIEKETVELKTETEIVQSIDKARDVAIDTVEKAGEASMDVGKAFEKGKQNVRKPKEEMVKIDLNSLNFPVAQYLDLSVRSNQHASFYETTDGVIACVGDKTDNCFTSIVIRTHSDKTRWICNGLEICYSAK
jgi:hypothetical protein